MSRLRLAALCLSVLAIGGCGIAKIEDRTPSGTRRDEDRIQHLINQYALNLSRRDWSGVRSLFWQDGTYSGPIGSGAPTDYHQAVSIDEALSVLNRRLWGSERRDFDVRVVRTDLRQEGDLAAAWLVTRRRTPSGSSFIERDWIEHVVLRRIDGDWRILSVAAASGPRGSSR